MPASILKSLDANLLRRACDPTEFSFKTTDELPELQEFVGQARALNATHFGIGINRVGFNIFALGPSGIGKRSIIRSLLEKEAKKKPRPKDICHIHNFKDPRHPLVLLLQPGMGKQLADDMLLLVDILRTLIPAIFESNDYKTRIKEIQEETRKKQDSAFAKLELEASKNELVILSTPEGFVLAATKNGEIISEKEFASLPTQEKAAKDQVMHKMHEQLTSFLEQVPNWHKEQREKKKEALKYFTTLQVGSVIFDVKKKYLDQPEIASYLNEVQQAILDNPTDFRKEESFTGLPGFRLEKPSFNQYRINVLVDNSELTGAPIIYEDNPNYANLVGRIDHVSQFGALVTDFTLIRAGALQKANGGYLLLDAIKLLSQPFAWEGLKRALRAREVRIENINQLMGFMGTVTLEPHPVPLDLKVLLLGDRYIYYLLCALDPEFLELFKVAADFDEDIERNPKNNLLFAQLLKSLAKKDHLKPIAKDAVVEMIDYGSRLVEDCHKVTTHVRRLQDLLREADYCCSQDNRSVIEARDVEKAIEQQIIRASRYKEEQFEHIAKGIVLIDTSGSKTGQINGLSYIQLGGFAFGHPARITARVGMGGGELIDIEREVKLGGPIHSKGVLILTGYLGGQFAKDEPLSLRASLVFEQSYGGVEGDSASAAEACALLSAIADIPIKQSIAITGSINQLGHIQAIGGVNEKIEGFFDVCRARGLTGEQGCIIPTANVDRLMLRKDIVEAAKMGLFHIYAVKTVDEAMEILTGIKAGPRNRAGKFPRNSINGKVELALKNFTKKAKSKRKPRRRGNG